MFWSINKYDFIIKNILKIYQHFKKKHNIKINIKYPFNFNI